MEHHRKAIIIGATGLVGKELLRQLIASESYDKIVVITRKPVGISTGKISEHIVDFDRLTDFSNLIQGDHAFCCLGTTMKKAGSKTAFRKVDYDYVLEFARIAASNKVPGFSLISSLGASHKSMVFYSRVKGETEAAVSSLTFEKVNIFRPSLLLGDRNEKRTGEDVAKITYKVIDFLLPKRYRGIQASVVARAMLKQSLDHSSGVKIFPSEKIQFLGRA
jgi:uncharacterized protein YbjT (DUF2867 family)